MALPLPADNDGNANNQSNSDADNSFLMDEALARQLQREELGRIAYSIPSLLGRYGQENFNSPLLNENMANGPSSSSSSSSAAALAAASMNPSASAAMGPSSSSSSSSIPHNNQMNPSAYNPHDHDPSHPMALDASNLNAYIRAQQSAFHAAAANANLNGNNPQGNLGGGGNGGPGGAAAAAPAGGIGLFGNGLLANGGGNDPTRPRRTLLDQVRDADLDSARLVLARVIVGLLELIATATVLGIATNESCNRPLVTWLIIFNLRLFITIPLRLYIYRIRGSSNDMRLRRCLQMLQWMAIIQFFCFLVGQSFLISGKKCIQTAPVLWHYSLIVIVCAWIEMASKLVILLGLCLCFPCMLLVFKYLAEPAGAARELIKNLPTRQFVSKNHLKRKKRKKMLKGLMMNHENGGDDDGDESGGGGGESPDDDDGTGNGDSEETCAICIASYEHGEELRILPCGHEFHSACVDTWLPMKAKCPLCRHDIMRGKGAAPDSAAAVVNHHGPLPRDEPNRINQPNDEISLATA